MSDQPDAASPPPPPDRTSSSETPSAQERAKPAAKPLEMPFECYYDSSSKGYLVKDCEGAWMEVSEGALMRQLRVYKISTQRPSGGKRNSPAESLIAQTQNTRRIHYSGSLAGYEAGLVRCGHFRVLVQHARSEVFPVGTNWSMLRDTLEAKLGPGGQAQLTTYYGWLKIFDQCLQTGIYMPGQAMALAGPPNSGKSLISKLTSYILGGRSACPYRYMMGITPFNLDLFGAELLIIDDEASSKDLRTRRHFGTQIKNMLYAEGLSAHGKGRDAVNGLRPFWRVLILVNDEPENLMILPPIDPSLEDKLDLLKTFAGPCPMPTRTPNERQAFWLALEEQIPAWLGWLRYEFTIPDEMVDSRAGIAAWRHPDLVRHLQSLSPETRLMELIDSVLFEREPRTEWQGTADELSIALRKSDFAHEAAKLLDWSNATGTYLGRLEKTHPGRVQKVRTMHSRDWLIKRDPASPPPPDRIFLIS